MYAGPPEHLYKPPTRADGDGRRMIASNDKSRLHAEATEESPLPLDDGEIHVRQDGPCDAPALLLIHGTAASLRSWDSMVPLLTGSQAVRAYLEEQALPQRLAVLGKPLLVISARTTSGGARRLPPSTASFPAPQSRCCPVSGTRPASRIRCGPPRPLDLHREPCRTCRLTPGRARQKAIKNTESALTMTNVRPEALKSPTLADVATIEGR